MVLIKDIKLEELRTCLSCDEEYKHYGQNRPICRDCKRAYDRNYHANRSEEKKLLKIENQNKRIRNNVTWIRDYKASIGCIDCGINDFRVLDFDHLPNSDKKFNIADSPTLSKKSLLREMEKCEVVCSNCHRVRTYERREESSGQTELRGES